MIDGWADFVASKHWPYVWPCYALCVAAFAALSVRAWRRLERWRRLAGAQEQT